MPFIFIDQGAAALKDYKTSSQPDVQRVHHSPSTQKVSDKTQIDEKAEEHAEARHTYEQVAKQLVPVKQAHEIMSHPVVCLDYPQLSWEEAWREMQQNKIRHLPIIQNEKLWGITSERQLLKSAHNHHKTPWYTREIFAATVDEDIHSLTHVMFDEHIGCLPILGSEHTLVGIITRSDLLKAMSHYPSLQLWA